MSANKVILILLVFVLTLLPCLVVAIVFLLRKRKELEGTNIKLNEKKLQLQALIRELHHRTKNNLQEISSMLYLQMSELKHPELKDVLNEARGRIDALSIIHRLLYQKKQDRFTSIRITDYVRELVQHLVRANDLGDKKVETHFIVQDVFIEMDTAVHIGLALNELLQNCFKHAFPHVLHPALSIMLSVEAGRTLVFQVSDNGPGLDPSAQVQEGESFGLKLVRLIVEGRDGTLSYETLGGATFHIVMPLHEGEVQLA